MPIYFTRKGDDGSTGLIGGRRVSKDHPQPEAYGALDEASAALGMARVLCRPEAAEILKAAQRDLYHIMAELAVSDEADDRERRLPKDRVQWLEAQIERFGAQVEMPREFVLAGDSPAGAAMDLARTIVRRAERRVVHLAGQEAVHGVLLAYLNRLSSLCFVLSLWENARAGSSHPTLAKDEPE